MGVQFAGNILVQSNGGPLPISQGGTGQTNATAAINALLPNQASQAGRVLTTDGTNVSWSPGGASAGGSDTQIQYNDSGNLGGNSFLTLNKSTGAVTSTSTLTNRGLNITGPNTTNRTIQFQTDGSNRWFMRANNVDETGSNLGSNFEFSRVADNGLTTNQVFTVERNSGVVDFKQTPTINGTPIDSGAGTVTSVAVSSSTAAISVSGSPITSSGTITVTANTFTASNPGVVSGSGGGTTNFLRADGTWAAPPGGSFTGGTVTGATTFTSAAPQVTLGTTSVDGLLQSTDGTSAAGRALTVRSGNGTTSNFAGGLLSLLGGNAAGTGNGGSINIITGLSGTGTTGNGGTLTMRGSDAASTNGTGGAVTIRTGNSSGTGGGAALSITGAATVDATGGAVNITGGSAAGVSPSGAARAGGAVNITGGAGADQTSNGGAGANVNITGGAGRNGNSNGGSSVLDGGAPSGTGTGGSVFMRASNGGGAGGAVTISSGSAGTGTFAGGNISISSGNGGSTGGSPGAITLTCGNALAGNTNGSAVTLSAGASAGSGTGGGMSFTAGNGGGSGNGGTFVISSGNSGTSNGAGGNITITGGSGFATGATININAGSATGGSGTRNGGSVAIRAGTGASNDGTISLGAFTGYLPRRVIGSADPSAADTSSPIFQGSVGQHDGTNHRTGISLGNNSNVPQVQFCAAGTSGNKYMRFQMNGTGTQFGLVAIDDAYTATTDFLTVTKTGTTPNAWTFTGTSYAFNGGGATIGGALTVNGTQAAVSNSNNGGTSITVANSNSGTAAFSRIEANNGSTALRMDCYGTAHAGGFANQSWVFTSTAQPLILGTNQTERMRISGSGTNIMMSATAPLSSSTLTIAQGGSAGAPVIASNHLAASGTRFHMAFYENGTERGNITSNGSAVSYNTSSDQRLKKNIIDAPSAIDKVKSIQVRSFDWQADDSHIEHGFIAQELQKVEPSAVHAPEEGAWGVDPSKLVATLTKALQETIVQVDQLKAEITKLKKLLK